MNQTRHRCRLVEWPDQDPKHYTLCIVAGAEELGVPVQPDDDLIVLYGPGTDRERLAAFIDYQRAAGYEVIAPESIREE